MRLPNPRTMGALALAALGLLAGCSKPNAPADPATDARRTELEEIGAAYRAYQDDQKRPPRAVADVKRFGVAFPEGLRAMKEGRCLVNWGLDVADPANASRVLAYDKDVPQQGGLVLMGDRTIKTMTPDEFRAAKGG